MYIDFPPKLTAQRTLLPGGSLGSPGPQPGLEAWRCWRHPLEAWRAPGRGGACKPGAYAQDVPPPTDPWKWGGAIGAWILSPAQADALNPKP